MEETGVGMTIAMLQERIHERRERQLRIDELPLGRGFSIRAERSMLFLTSEAEPDERVLCGFVEDDPRGPRWLLFREWAVLLRETFGELPSELVVDGDPEAA